MKLLTLTIVAAVGFSLPSVAFAQEKKKKEAAPAATAKKAADKPAAAGAPAAEKKATKPMPMSARVDSIDVAGKSFTMKRQDGKEIKHMISDTTEIKNGEAAAKLEDIKVGDWVGGLRLKKSETEYDVVKITKFGPRPTKAGNEAAKDAKPAKKEAAKPDAKTEEKK